MKLNDTVCRKASSQCMFERVHCAERVATYFLDESSTNFAKTFNNREIEWITWNMQRFITQAIFPIKILMHFLSWQFEASSTFIRNQKWMRIFNFICMNCIFFWHRFYGEFCGNRYYFFFLVRVEFYIEGRI